MLGKVLIDPGRSAWNPAVKREAWDELMDRLERDVSGGENPWRLRSHRD